MSEYTDYYVFAFLCLCIVCISIIIAFWQIPGSAICHTCDQLTDEELQKKHDREFALEEGGVFFKEKENG